MTTPPGTEEEESWKSLPLASAEEISSESTQDQPRESHSNPLRTTCEGVGLTEDPSVPAETSCGQDRLAGGHDVANKATCGQDQLLELSSRVGQLAQLVEDMTARFVLVETQLMLAQSQGEREGVGRQGKGESTRSQGERSVARLEGGLVSTRSQGERVARLEDTLRLQGQRGVVRLEEKGESIRLQGQRESVARLEGKGESAQRKGVGRLEMFAKSHREREGARRRGGKGEEVMLTWSQDVKENEEEGGRTLSLGKKKKVMDGRQPLATPDSNRMSGRMAKPGLSSPVCSPSWTTSTRPHPSSPTSRPHPSFLDRSSCTPNNWRSPLQATPSTVSSTYTSIACFKSLPSDYLLSR